MNIGIDARILERKMTGIGRFLKTFLNELPAVDKKNKYFLFSYEGIKPDNSYFTDVPTGRSFLPQKLFAPFWINFVLPKYLKENNIDVFFSVNQLTPLRKVKGVKYILVLHDVIYKVDKTFHPFIYRKYLQFFTYFSIKKCDLIVTVSEYSKQDILKHYMVDESKVKVVYQAAEKEFRPMNLSDAEKTEIKKQFGSPEHIVLYLGMIENRKNIKCILETADLVYKKNDKVKFILVGKIGYGGDELLNEMKKRDYVIHLQNIDDELLKKMYNVSSVFLFPSLYEGFGYPPLEAMQSGLPVLASNSTSLKEVVGSGGILHDANDAKAFADDICRLISDKNFYEMQRKKGIEKAAEFSIHKTVREQVEIFNSIL